MGTCGVLEEEDGGEEMSDDSIKFSIDKGMVEPIISAHVKKAIMEALSCPHRGKAPFRFGGRRVNFNEV